MLQGQYRRDFAGYATANERTNGAGSAPVRGTQSQGGESDHPPQQKENRQTAATVWRRAAFRKTQIPSVFSLAESLPKRKIFFL